MDKILKNKLEKLKKYLKIVKKKNILFINSITFH